MKLLFLNTNIGYGGASKQMVWVANMCAEAGHKVTFVTYRDGTENQPLSDKVRHEHLPLEPVSGRGEGMLSAVKVLHRYIRRNGFDVAVGFLSPSQFRLSLACMGTSTKLLFSLRGDPYQHSEGWKNYIIGRINSWAFRRADWYVFQTPMARDCFPDSIRSRSTVIANPIVPMERTRSRREGVEKNIVSVARLDIRQKRQDLLIEAFLRIAPHNPDYNLCIYGDGDDEHRLRQMAGGCQQIRFMGKTTTVAAAIEQAAMFVLSSDFEGIPNALLEAMSLGVPCISTNCSPGGAAMLIEDGVNGLLVPCGDAVALAEAMQRFIDHPAEREAMGREGMKVNERFAEVNIKEEWFKAFRYTADKPTVYD